MSYIVLKSLKDKVGFGKYKEMLIQDVLISDPSYLMWAHDNVKWFKLESEIYDSAVDSAFNEQVGKYIEDSPYWIDDDNGSWLT